MKEFPFIKTDHIHDRRFQYTLDIVVQDAEQLWISAAARCSSFGGMDDEDIEDVIGPRQDPDIAACLSMLMAPSAVAGCQAIDFAIMPAQAVCVVTDWAQAQPQVGYSIVE